MIYKIMCIYIIYIIYIYIILYIYIYIYICIYLYLAIFIFMFVSIYGIRSKKRSSGWCVGTYSIEGPFGKSPKVLLHGGHMVPAVRMPAMREGSWGLGL